MTNYRKKVNRIAAVSAVFLTLAVLFVPISSDCDTDAAVGETYTYTISPDGTISGGYEPIGSSSTGKYTSVNGTNSGSWAFDEDGYGPFNSFYAAFDPAQNNRMIGHLDPDDLTKLVDGTSIAEQDYNIMWCLPTVYWKTSGTSLVLTNDPNAGGTAYAHTINGHVYSYIGIGVYEASKQTVGGQTILTSFTDSTPTVNQTRATFRDQANNQLVNTDGNGNNGYAMLWNFYQWELYKYCALAVMGSWNSQAVAGNGNVYGGDHTHTTGDHDKSGPYAGTKGSSTTYYRDPAKVFIESTWGGAFDFVDGIVVSAKEYYIDQSAVPTDKTSGTYITNPSGTLPGSIGYGSNPSTEAVIWGMPTTTGGSASSGLCDYVYSDNGNNYVVFVGGDSHTTASSALNYGLSYIFCYYDLSYLNSDIGGRLAFVFDADPASGYTVTYDHSALIGAGGDASTLPTSTVVPKNEILELPDLGTIDGFIHTGWRIYGAFYGGGEHFFPYEDVTIHSVWEIPSVTITFSVEGSTYATLSVPKGSTGIVFTPIDVEGIFTGWFYDPGFEDEYDPVSPITTDITLYAKGAPPLVFTTDPVADGDIVALNGQPGTISFRATDSEDFTSVLWDFGDGQVSTDLYSTHYYAEPGSYTATLASHPPTLPVSTPPRTPPRHDLPAVPRRAPGGGGKDLLLWVAVGLMLIVAGGLVVRRLL